MSIKLRKNEDGTVHTMVLGDYEIPVPVAHWISGGSASKPTNVKLGPEVVSWSTLQGDEMWEVHDPVLGDFEIAGTCGGFCDSCKESCYAYKATRYHGKTVIPGRARNTVALRDDPEKTMQELGAELDRKRNPVLYARLNQSGEVEIHPANEDHNEDENDLLHWNALATTHPNTLFYIYTKNIPALRELVNTNSVSNNFKNLMSIWGFYGLNEWHEFEHEKNVKAFVYTDDVFTVDWYAQHGLVIEAMCPAYKNGKLNHAVTCSKCKKCFDNKTRVIGTEPH